MKFKFNVGDKVRVLDGSKIQDYTGGWVDGNMSEYIGHEYRIESRKINSLTGYPCYDLVDDWHTWDERGLEPADLKRKKEKITVYREGNKVIAIDQRTGKKGIARCHPDDEFDFSVGAALAFGRLMGRAGDDALDAVCADQPAKFKVGDRVIGNDQADKHYSIATQGWVGTVVAVYPDGTIDVKGADGPFRVDEDYFDSYKGFCVGDKVKVIDTGEMHTTYTGWVIEHVRGLEAISKYAYGDNSFDLGVRTLEPVFTVLYVDTDERLAYIQNGSVECHLVGWDGLKLIKEETA